MGVPSPGRGVVPITSTVGISSASAGFRVGLSCAFAVTEASTNADVTSAMRIMGRILRRHGAFFPARPGVFPGLRGNGSLVLLNPFPETSAAARSARTNKYKAEVS